MSRVASTENSKYPNEFTGTVERVTYRNSENSWSVLKVSSNLPEMKIIAVLVNDPNASVGSVFRFKGKWIEHKKFGKQFQANVAIEQKPQGIEHIQKYLGSGLIKGLGPKTAEKIVSHFKEKTLEILDADIDRIMQVPGVSYKKLKTIAKSWSDQQGVKESMIFLQRFKIGALMATKIIKKYGNDIEDKITSDPYRLARDINGMGFFTADEVAKVLNITGENPLRIKAAISHLLLSAQEQGHCYLTRSQVQEELIKLINVDNDELISQCLEKSLVLEEICMREVAEEKYYYSKKIYWAERKVASMITTLSNNQSIDKNMKFDDELTQVYDGLGFKLSKQQESAVKAAMTSSFGVLTGGPGCGKTTTLKALVKLLIIKKKNVLLAAPTGRAAQRMEEVIGLEAKTIHRLLEYNPEGGFKKNKEQPLDADYLIVDECSMLDINLSYALMSAISNKTQVLLIGDPDQLPSVGPGNVLLDIINSRKVDVLKLDIVFRQAGESAIVNWAHNINQGFLPELISPLEEADIWSKSDCIFLDSALEESEKMYKPNTLEKGFNGLQALLRVYSQTLPKVLDKDSEIQILSPQIRGSMGVENLNLMIQDHINPKRSDNLEIVIGEKKLRLGDRVIQTRNNYDLGIFNGEIGRVTHVNSKDRTLEVQFGKDKSHYIIYEDSDLLDLQLAYGITIHKSQGSEFDAVIIPMYGQHFKMLYQNLIYTAITRAKKMVVFIGERRAFQMAVKNKNASVRQTYLQELLQE